MYAQTESIGLLTNSKFYKTFKLKMEDGCRLNEAYHDRGSVEVVAV